MNPNSTNIRGFTLIELLVVISIIGLLASVVLASLNGARTKARIAKAQQDLQQIEVALTLLNHDTGFGPGPGVPKTLAQCGTTITISDPNETYLDIASAGLVATDGNFGSKWNGPYMDVMPTDPWGNRYWFDEDYACTNGVIGCEGRINGNTSLYRVVGSGGPNGTGINVYDSDNVVKILCSRG